MMVTAVPWKEETTRISEVLRQSKSVLILEHKKPDGDCIGSGLGLALGLLFLGKRVLLLSQDAHPSSYDFLPGQYLHSTISEMTSDPVSFDTVVFLDCTDPHRTGKCLSFAVGDMIINIDHHVSNSQYGDVCLVDPGASSTGELVFFLLKALGVPITRNIALCLYCAIASDTGGFRYQNTTARALWVASELVEVGADPSRVADYLFETRSLSSLLLLRSALQTLTLHFGGNVASVEVTRDMVENSGSSFDETEGIINYPRSIEGVEVALCFKETPDGQGVDVSFRSKHRVDVAKIAESLGGGGHARAAGAFILGSLDQAKIKVFGVLSKEDI